MNASEELLRAALTKAAQDFTPRADLASIAVQRAATCRRRSTWATAVTVVVAVAGCGAALGSLPWRDPDGRLVPVQVGSSVVPSAAAPDGVPDCAMDEFFGVQYEMADRGGAATARGTNAGLRV